MYDSLNLQQAKNHMHHHLNMHPILPQLMFLLSEPQNLLNTLSFKPNTAVRHKFKLHVKIQNVGQKLTIACHSIIH